MQPFRYISEVASTKTFKPSKLKLLSIMPPLFSNDIEYEKPEHPPPTTPTRSPAGTGLCWVMISFTFAMAVGVKLSGIGLGCVSVGAVVTGVVDIQFS